jgi:hypothetical protein
MAKTAGIGVYNPSSSTKGNESDEFSASALMAPLLCRLSNGDS